MCPPGLRVSFRGLRSLPSRPGLRDRGDGRWVLRGYRGRGSRRPTFCHHPLSESISQTSVVTSPTSVGSGSPGVKTPGKPTSVECLDRGRLSSPLPPAERSSPGRSTPDVRHPRTQGRRGKSPYPPLVRTQGLKTGNPKNLTPSRSSRTHHRRQLR